jgi:hypothetical protein
MLSGFAFNFNLRRYTKRAAPETPAAPTTSKKMKRAAHTTPATPAPSMEMQQWRSLAGRSG